MLGFCSNQLLKTANELPTSIAIQLYNQKLSEQQRYSQYSVQMAGTWHHDKSSPGNFLAEVKTTPE